jgi:tRNA G18 (ribose-2'-O)-methylase SpoU
LDRFGRSRADLHKAALGAEDSVAWESRGDVVGLIHELQSTNHEVIALEQDPKSIDYKIHKAGKDCVLIVGNEVEGVSKDILDICDKIIQIPMKGKKESLNVSVATGIALFRLLNV